MTEQQIDLRERELDYWMTRAYEAEGKLWKAEARIKAALELHAPHLAYRLIDGEDFAQEPDGDVCVVCGEYYPCDTIRALESVPPPSV